MVVMMLVSLSMAVAVAVLPVAVLPVAVLAVAMLPVAVLLVVMLAVAMLGMVASRLVHACQHARRRPLQHIDNGKPNATAWTSQLCGCCPLLAVRLVAGSRGVSGRLAGMARPGFRAETGLCDASTLEGPAQ